MLCWEVFTVLYQALVFQCVPIIIIIFYLYQYLNDPRGTEIMLTTLQGEEMLALSFHLSTLTYLILSHTLSAR